MWGDIPNWAEEVTQALMASLKLKDPETFYHCCRVGKMAGLLAQAAGLNEYEQKVAEFSGLFHDIGKISLPSHILHKAGSLNKSEYELVKEHPLKSAEILQPIENPFFKDLIPGVECHHERVDGRGYPFKLLGDEIPLMARLILIVDTCDAMSQSRSYREGLPMDIVYREIKKFSGQQFDSQLAKIFLEAHPHWQKRNSDEDLLTEILSTTAA